MNRFFKVFLAVMLVALMASGAVSALAEQAEQVFSEAFDAASAGASLPSGWVFHSYQDEYFSNSGVSHAEVVTLEDDPARGGVLHMFSAADDDAAAYITVAVEPSTVYRISCYIKTEGVMCDAPDNAGDASGANIALRGNVIVRSKGILGSGDWQLAEIVGVTSSSQNQITVSCRIGGYSSVARGEAWFDDFKVEKLSGYTGETVNLFADQQEGGEAEKSASGMGWLPILIGALVAALIAVAVIAAVKGRNRDDGSAAGSEKTVRTYSDETDDRVLIRDRIRGKSFWQLSGKMPGQTDNKLHFVKLDWIFVIVLTAVYAFIALFRLGTLNFPTSSWSASAGQTVRIEFAQSAVIKEVWQNTGVSYSDYTLTADNGETMSISASDDPSSYWHMFKWKKLEVPSGMTATSGVTLTVISGDNGRPKEPDLVINELAFFDSEGNLIPCSVSNPAAAAIVDEQRTVPEYPSYFTGMYFDEVYHARTAYEHLNNLNVYEWTHPPLGKLIISIGIMIFGMKPFGWRFMGALFGILMVPIFYCFSKRIVKRPKLSLLSTVLFTFDFMHFTQTRIATVDTYALFFTLLMTYYMYQFVCTDIGDGIGKMFKPLALSGLFFGLGCASKWTCIYVGAALAVLFFGKLILMLVQSIRVTSCDPDNRSALPRFVFRGCMLCLWCVLFFIIVPLVIYCASYCRYYTAQWKPAEQQKIVQADPSRGENADDVKLTLSEALDTYVKGVIKNQQDMYNYHSGLESEHKASSPWWMWIFNLRPTWFYVTYPPNGTTAGTISSFGNPAVWNLCFLGTLGLIVTLIVRRRFTREAAFLFVCMAATLLPWVLVTRSTYAYHYFSTVPFIILASVYALKYLEDYNEYRVTLSEGKKFGSRFIPAIKYIWMGLAVLLFIIFYPVISGLEVPKEYIYLLQWVPFKKLELKDAAGNIKRTLRMGWTFLGYGD